MNTDQRNQIQSLLIANAKAPDNNVGVLSIDAIMAIVPQIAEILNTEKWIDVKKEYPPLNTMVLTTQHARMDVNEPRYFIVLKFDNHGNWVTEFGESDDTYFEPTHWQPLPKIPKDNL